MAYYLNQYHVMGNLVADPEIKNLSGDKKVCKFRIAVNNPHNESAAFMSVDVWGKEGEKCNLLKKGAQVFITNASVLPKSYTKKTSCGEEVKINTFTINVDGYCGKVQFGPKNQNSSENSSDQKSEKKSQSPKPKETTSKEEVSEESSSEEVSSFEEEFEF